MASQLNQHDVDIAALDAIIGRKTKSARKAEGGATRSSFPRNTPPHPTSSRRKAAKPQAIPAPETINGAPAAPISEFPEASSVTAANPPSPRENQSGPAGADEGRLRSDNQCTVALIGELIAEIFVMNRFHRSAGQMKRALEAQGKATCRSYAGGDKVEGKKLWDSEEPPLALQALLIRTKEAKEPLEAAEAHYARVLERLGKQLPVADWCAGIQGFSYLKLARIVGECGIGPGEFKSPSALWKRMGLAVIDGKRQRRVTGDAALEHGYVAHRAALMWQIGQDMLMHQIGSEKDENKKKIEGTDFAKGRFGEVYLERKAYLRAKNEAGDYAERSAEIVAASKRNGSTPAAENLAGRLTPTHIHNDAQRYMLKRLLKELWQTWRRANPLTGTNTPLPAVETNPASGAIPCASTIPVAPHSLEPSPGSETAVHGSTD